MKWSHLSGEFLEWPLKPMNFCSLQSLRAACCISKESIFTGLNNFRVMSITDARFDEQFGFTDNEVRKLLEDYNYVHALQ